MVLRPRSGGLHRVVHAWASCLRFRKQPPDARAGITKRDAIEHHFDMMVLASGAWTFKVQSLRCRAGSRLQHDCFMGTVLREQEIRED